MTTPKHLNEARERVRVAQKELNAIEKALSAENWFDTAKELGRGLDTKVWKLDETLQGCSEFLWFVDLKDGGDTHLTIHHDVRDGKWVISSDTHIVDGSDRRFDSLEAVVETFMDSTDREMSTLARLNRSVQKVSRGGSSVNE